MRLNRFLASAGLGSRRAVEALILEGSIRINGRVVESLATQVLPTDAVKVGRRLIAQEDKLTAVLHKPRGYVCTAKDNLGRETIFKLLPDGWPRLFHVGRLDKESEGLLLMTNDGDLANALAHPRYAVEKEYEVTLDREWVPALAAKLLRGVLIEGGKAKAERVVQEGPCFLRIVLTQGINRQVHKMLWRVGEYDVKRLKRVRLGAHGYQIRNYLITGLAYRPVRVNWFNALAKFELRSDNNFYLSPFVRYLAAIVSAHGYVEPVRRLELGLKYAYRTAHEESGLFEARTHTFFYLVSARFDISQTFDIGGEYRLLWQTEARDLLNGYSAEIGVALTKDVKVSGGYNFKAFVLLRRPCSTLVEESAQDH